MGLFHTLSSTILYISGYQGVVVDVFESLRVCFLWCGWRWWWGIKKKKCSIVTVFLFGVEIKDTVCGLQCSTDDNKEIL